MKYNYIPFGRLSGSFCRFPFNMYDIGQFNFGFNYVSSLDEYHRCPITIGFKGLDTQIKGYIDTGCVPAYINEKVLDSINPSPTEDDSFIKHGGPILYNIKFWLAGYSDYPINYKFGLWKDKDRGDLETGFLLGTQFLNQCQAFIYDPNKRLYTLSL